MPSLFFMVSPLGSPCLLCGILLLVVVRETFLHFCPSSAWGFPSLLPRRIISAFKALAPGQIGWNPQFIKQFQLSIYPHFNIPGIIQQRTWSREKTINMRCGVFCFVFNMRDSNFQAGCFQKSCVQRFGLLYVL